MNQAFVRPLALAGGLVLMLGAAPSRAQEARPLCTQNTRVCYEKTVNAYFDGLLKTDGSAVPFAPDLKVTEQGKVVVTDRAAYLREFKQSGAIQDVRNIRIYADEKTGQVATFVLVEVGKYDGGKPYTIRRAQRFKIIDGVIKEVEIINYRDPTAGVLWPN